MTTRHRFGRFEVRPAERLLLIDGEPATLGARAFDLLLALIDQRDRLMTKNELLDRVWPHLVVEENNLQTQVSNLRKLLGPQAIATIPGRGYRFTLVEDAQPASATYFAAAPAALPPPAPLPPASPNSRPLTALPHATALFGRSDDLAALVAQARQHAVVTLLGAGGIGKTALALAAAHWLADAHAPNGAAFRDGAAWVELAPITDAALIPSALAQALRLPLGGGLGSGAGVDEASALAAIVHALAPLHMLLVLDNAEHQIDAVARLALAITSAAPQVHLLVTSQAPLRIDGERVFRLAALEVPALPVSANDAAGCGAVALFVDQAQAADRHFALTDANAATVIALCRELDGLALGIKLAAARLPLLGLDGLAARLTERLQLLGSHARGTPTRQQTLRAAFDWSHGLLSPTEQTVFRRLGAFVGGFSLELACDVASDESIDHWAVVDVLGALVDRSLVAATGTAPQRYRLPEIARDYAGLKLAEAGEREAIQQRHAEAIAKMFDQSCEAYWHTADAPWLASCAPELDNLRAALDWGTRHAPALARRTISAASFVFLLLGLAAEARSRWMALQPIDDEGDEGKEGDEGNTREPHAPRFWLEGSRLHWRISERLVRGFAERAVAGYRSAHVHHGDHRSELRDDHQGLYLALRCAAASAETPTADALAMLAEMARLERPSWPPRLRAQRLLAEVDVRRAEGQMALVRDLLERLRALAAPAGLETVTAFALSGLADANLSLGHSGEAIRQARALLAGPDSLPRSLQGNYGLPVLATLGSALLAEGDAAGARDAIRQFTELSRSRGWEWFGRYADLFALLAASEGRDHDAARLIGHADAVQARLGARDVNAARSRARAEALIAHRLDAAAFARLSNEGRSLGEAEVCALALAER